MPPDHAKNSDFVHTLENLACLRPGVRIVFMLSMLFDPLPVQVVFKDHIVFMTILDLSMSAQLVMF